MIYLRSLNNLLNKTHERVRSLIHKNHVSSFQDSLGITTVKLHIRKTQEYIIKETRRFANGLLLSAKETLVVEKRMV